MSRVHLGIGFLPPSQSVPPNSLNSELFREWLCTVTWQDGYSCFFITQFQPNSGSFRDPPLPHCILKPRLPEPWDLTCALLPAPPKQRPYNRIRAWSLRVRTLPIFKSQQKPLEPSQAALVRSDHSLSSKWEFSFPHSSHYTGWPSLHFVFLRSTRRWEFLRFWVWFYSASTF